MKIIVSKPFKYQTRYLKCGDECEVTDEQAKLLLAWHFAEMPKPKSKRQYLRRDMVAEDK